MDISKMTEIELKALAYETMKRIHQEQINLQVIEQRIAQLQEAANGTQKD